MNIRRMIGYNHYDFHCKTYYYDNLSLTIARVEELVIIVIEISIRDPKKLREWIL